MRPATRPGLRGADLAARGHEPQVLEPRLFNHTWSTRAAECGVPDSVRRDILGHSPVTMTDSYTHSSPEAMERAMELVADYSREKIFSLTAKSRQAG